MGGGEGDREPSEERGEHEPESEGDRSDIVDVVLYRRMVVRESEVAA